MPKVGWSPSQQEANQYAGGGTGYTDSEQYWMELMAAACHQKWVEQQTGIPDVVFEKGSYSANVAASNAAGVTHHIALHTNAGGGTGLEIWHHTNSTEGKKMAEALYKYIAPATDTADRGVKNSTKYGELNGTVAKAVIIEYLFHDSVSQAAEIRRSIDEFATATVKGLCEYFGKAYKAPVPAQDPVTVPTPTPTPTTPTAPSEEPDASWTDGVLTLVGTAAQLKAAHDAAGDVKLAYTLAPNGLLINR